MVVMWTPRLVTHIVGAVYRFKDFTFLISKMRTLAVETSSAGYFPSTPAAPRIISQQLLSFLKSRSLYLLLSVNLLSRLPGGSVAFRPSALQSAFITSWCGTQQRDSRYITRPRPLRSPPKGQLALAFISSSLSVPERPAPFPPHPPPCVTGGGTAMPKTSVSDS